MLKEIIKFTEKLPKEVFTVEGNWEEEKFFIIKTREQNNKLVYDGYEIADDSSAITRWIDENEHYKDIVQRTGDYILPSERNKTLGSVQGLSTYSFFVFKLPKNPSDLDKKINKTRFNDERDDEIQIENIHEILKVAKSYLMEKINGNFKFSNYTVLIHTDKTRFEKWKKIADHFIEDKMSYGKKTMQEDVQCYVCGKKAKNSSPDFLFNNNDKKIFLRHITRNTIGNQGMALFACKECILKSNKFKKFLEKYKIKIFPLFVNDTQEQINLLDDKLKNSKNKFAFIFDQLKKDDDFHFYLVVKSNKYDYFFFDYITCYKWNLGEYVDFFSNPKKKVTKQEVTRQDIEIEISKIMSKKPHIDYFDSLKKMDSRQKTIIYSLRQKLFDFVYRNQNTITEEDLVKIILFRIKNEIQNNSNNTKYCRETLNLFFNRGLLLKTSVNKDVLSQIEESKRIITEKKFKEFEIRDDNEWAYFAGQLAYYLVNLSQSKNKNYGLLEPFTNKATTKLVKITINEMYEKYKHKISLNNAHFRTIATQVLAYEIDRSFMDIKISFYVGAFDNNIIKL